MLELTRTRRRARPRTRWDATTFAALLRAGDPALVGRLHGGRVVLDVRTLTDAEADDGWSPRAGGARTRVSPGQPPLTLGTAGHIDHGKTALVAALTGVDTDRLPEEQARGMSIELGYARLTLADGRRVSVVDVPGHERFVRTMVAGAGGIDFYLMVDRRRRRRDAPDPRARRRPGGTRRRPGGDRDHQDRPGRSPSGGGRGCRAASGDRDRQLLAADRGRGRRARGRARPGRRPPTGAGCGRPAGGPPHRPGVHDPRRRNRRHRDALVGRDRSRGLAPPAARRPGRPRSIGRGPR